MASAGDTVFGHFKLQREIGRGGMGTVWLGAQEVAGATRSVGVKTLSAEMGVDAKNVQLFLGEAQVVSLLNHPNIVSVLQGGAWAGEHFIVMEYVEGETLSRLARAQSRVGLLLPLVFSVETIRDVALALSHAHSAVDSSQRPLQLVHRDISPQNIMVRLDGLTKLLDFGIARVANRAVRTETGILRGKLRYFSPEQFLGHPMDGRTDQYALGIVLFELITGMAYIESEEVHVVWERLNALSAPAPSTLNPLVPRALDEIVLRMLSREPAERYPSCREVARALTLVLEQLPPAPQSREALVETLAGVEIRERVRGTSNALAPLTESHVNRQQCAGCHRVTSLTDKFCPGCGRALTRNSAARAKTSAVSLVLIDVVVSAPAAVGPLAVARALRGITELGHENAAQLISMHPTGLRLALGLPRAASDDLTRAVALAERLSNTVRLVDPGLLAGVVITSGMGVASNQDSGVPLVMGPVLEQAERHRIELKPGRIVVEASAARVLNRPTVGLTLGLAELLRTHRELRAAPKAFEIGREGALADLEAWARSGSSRNRVKAWAHVFGDGASSLLRLAFERLSSLPTPVRLHQVNGLQHAQPYSLIRRVIDEVYGLTKLPNLGLLPAELELTQKALERQPVERPDVLPTVLGATLLKVLAASPVVLLVDDTHLADVESLRVLNQVARQVREPSAMLLVVSVAALEPLALVDVEPLPGLSESDFARLWQARGEPALEAAAATALWATSRNLIGRALELGHEAIRLKVLKPVGDRLTLVGSLEACLANEASVGQRLEALSDEASKYLERAAVLGGAFSRAWVSAAVGLRSDESVLEELQAQQFIDAEHRMADARLRSAVLEHIPAASLRRARVELAFCANEAYPDDAVTALSEEARLFAEADHPNAIRTGLAAASRLEAVGAPLEAISALSRVLRKLRSKPSSEVSRGEVAATLMRLSLGCALERGLFETRAVLEEALDEAARAGLVSWWAKGALLMVKVDEAARWVELALAVPGLDDEVKARLLGSHASVALARGQSAEAKERLLAAFHLMNARPAKEPNFYWEHLNLLGRACVEMGDLPEASTAFESALSQATLAASDVGRARALTNLAGLALRQQRAGEALELLETAGVLATTSLDRQELARVQLNRANTLMHLGRTDDAKREALAAESSTQLSGWVEGLGLVNALLRRLEAQL